MRAVLSRRRRSLSPRFLSQLDGGPETTKAGALTAHRLWHRARLTARAALMTTCPSSADGPRAAPARDL